MFPPIVTPAPPPQDLATTGVARIETALGFRSSASGLKLNVGELVKADILSLSSDGSVSVRITRESGESAVVSARSQVPLNEGEQVLLKVTVGEGEVKLRLVSMADGEGGGKPGFSGAEISYKEAAGAQVLARMPLADIRQMHAIFRAFPDSVKALIPGFSLLEGETPVEGLTGQALKNTVEGSGVLFETKLLLQPDASASGADRKEALLRVASALRDTGVSSAVRGAGINPGDAVARTERALSTIEAHQVFSSENNVLYAPLMLGWDKLLDGEILFRKKNRQERESYTCEMNLDLAPLGKMSISVTMYEGAFFVSLYPENEATRSLMNEHSEDIGKRFREAGLDLRAVAVQRKQNIPFGVPSTDGVDLRV